MRVLGMISGTSHDGIDIAVCDFRQEGDALVGRVELVDAVPYSATVREAIVAALPPLTTTTDAITRLDTLIGREFTAAAATAIQAHEALGLGPVDVVCSHGQTVFHWVEGPVAEGTLQLGQPAWLAEATGLPVVSDVRSADIVAGGQGAPLVCLLDTLVLEPLRAHGRTVAALNLGGISNVTVCAPGQDPVAWDIGTANALIDAAVSADPSTSLAFDHDGLIGRSGTVVPALLDILLDEPYYRAPAPKSTGKELFHAAYLDEAVARHGAPVGLADLVATLVELTARTVADALAGRGVDEVFVSGGGVRNPTLLAAIAAAAPATRFSTTAALGLDPDAKEAVAFALIGWATMHGLPGNVPSCTGARGPRVLGRVTPGAPGSLLPVWRGVAPARLILESAVNRATSQPASPELGIDLSRAVDAVLALGSDDTHPAGAVVGVLVNGRPTTAAGGVAVAAAGDQPARAMTTDTRFDVASVTKMASSTALAMRLVADGSLTLDAPVTDYLPGFGDPGTATEVTVRHLLEHTSGLPPWVPLYCRTTERAEALTRAAATPLVTEPGVRWVYSDLGMIVLGGVIEAVTGMRQDAAFTDRVAAPLGLRRTAYGPVPPEETAAGADSDVIEHRMVATGDPYSTDAVVADFAGWRDAPVVGTASDGNAAHALGGVAGHAGLFATVPELLRIGRSLVDPDVVPASVIAEFTRPLAVAQDRGLGLRLGVHLLAGQHIPFAFHPGFTGAWLGVALDRDLVIAVVATRLHTTTGGISSPRAGRSELVTTDAIAETAIAHVSAALESAGYPAPTGAP